MEYLIYFLGIIVLVLLFIVYKSTTDSTCSFLKERLREEEKYRDKYFSMLIELFNQTEKTLKEDLYPDQAEKIMSKIRLKMHDKFPGDLNKC